MRHTPSQSSRQSSESVGAGLEHLFASTSLDLKRHVTRRCRFPLCPHDEAEQSDQPLVDHCGQSSVLQYSYSIVFVDCSCCDDDDDGDEVLQYDASTI